MAVPRSAPYSRLIGRFDARGHGMQQYRMAAKVETCVWPRPAPGLKPLRDGDGKNRLKPAASLFGPRTSSRTLHVRFDGYQLPHLQANGDLRRMGHLRGALRTVRQRQRASFGSMALLDVRTEWSGQPRRSCD